MVLLQELKQNNMFWGVSVDGGKRYTQVVETSFHMSMAALEPSPVEIPKGKRLVSLWIQHEKAEFLLCTLEHGRTMQQPVDLNFTEGEEITLFTTGGNGSIHLSGYLMDEADIENEMQELSEEDMSEEEEDSEAEVPQLLPLDDGTIKPGKKRKMLDVETKKKKQKVVVECEGLDFDSDDDANDADYTLEDDVNLLGETFEDDGEDDDDDDDDDVEGVDDNTDDDSDIDEEEEEEDIDDSPEEQIILQNKKNKTDKSAEQQKTKNKTPKVNGTPTESESSKKKRKRNKNKEKGNNSSLSTPTRSEQKTKEKTPQKETAKQRVLAEGLMVEDIKIGSGPPAKSNKMIHMFYVGRLSNGKQFDSVTGGKPFKFRLGKKEVIKGWDIGVQGMKVGGKRRLIVPPKLGYGNQKQGPIPVNSTLIFDVELKAVS